jgi:hypothetical protein
MDILINDEPVRFELEGEQNLKDVLSGLDDWARGQKTVIGSVIVDDEPLDLEDTVKNLDRSVDSIGVLRIWISSRSELALDMLRSIEEYILHTESVHLPEEGFIEHHDAVLESLTLIGEGFETICTTLGIPARLVPDRQTDSGRGISLADHLAVLRETIDRLTERYLSGDDIASIRTLFRALASMIPSVAFWVLVKGGGAGSLTPEGDAGDGSPRESLAAALKGVAGDVLAVARQNAGTFERIGENLQIGRDGEAFRDFSLLIEVLEELTALAGPATRIWGREPDRTRKVFGDIADVLRGVEGAYGDGDMVALGDLIEYELRPRYRKAVELFESLFEGREQS